MSLERRYRRLLGVFPARWREHNGEQLLGTLLEGSRTGQRWPTAADTVDLVVSGARVRLRSAGPMVQILGAALVLAAAIAVVDTLVTPTPLAFLLTSLVVVLIPGTGVVYSVSASITSGWRTGSLAAFGCTLGIVPHLAAAAVGLSGLMQVGAAAFEVVRWIGVVYLAYLGVRMIRSRGSVTDPGAAATTSSAGATIGRGVLLNVLNPKLTVFFFAFLPQFLATPPGLFDVRLVGLSAVFMAMTLAVFLVYAACASAVREKVLATPRLMRRIERSLGLVLFGFAARLAVSDR